MCDKIRKTMIVVSKLTGTNIVDRDFDWYYKAAFKSMLTKEEIASYDDLFNSNEWRKFDGDLPETKGFKEVDVHMEKYSINSEEAEYMWELSHIDCWVLSELNKGL